MDRGRRYQKTPMVKKAPVWKRWVFILLVMILIISITQLTIYFVRSNRNREMQALLAQQHQEALDNDADEAVQTQTVPETTVKPAATVSSSAAIPAQAKELNFFQVIGLTQKAMKPFVKQNDDTVGWITIDGIVDQPIVYRDNVYYLTHDFYGNRNACGAIFLDENHPLHKDAQNLLLYGHNMKDGSMFGRLTKYTSDNYLHSHHILQLETRFESFTYLIFAADKLSTEYRSKDYLSFWAHYTFSNQEDFDTYIDDVYEHSLYTRYLDVDDSDTLLTLATCYEDERLVLFARRQRSDETDADIQKALLGLYMK